MSSEPSIPAGQPASPAADPLASAESCIAVRPMTLADVPQVSAVDKLSFSLPWPERSFIFELTRNENSLCRVVEATHLDGSRRVIGLAVVWVILDEAHIATLAIHPDYRGRSLGKGLLAELLRELIQRGVVLATLDVREGNLAAQALYKSFGFDVAGVRPRYYKDNNENAILMTVNGLDGNYLAHLNEHFNPGGCL